MPIPSEPPLAGVGQTAPRKSAKKRKYESEDPNNPRYPIPIETLQKMSATQLRKVAQENSKLSMSSADQVAFMELFHEQELAMILKAIELHVSMPMVWAVFFLTAGVDMSPFVKPTAGTDSCRRTKPVRSSKLAGRASRISKGDELTAAELAMDEVTDEEEDTPETEPAAKGSKNSTGVIRGTVSNLTRKNQVDLTMNRWAREAANLSATCCCEVVIFAVSKHLSNHCFRMDRCTPGAFKPNSEISQMDGNNQYSARLQALVTGNSVGQIAVGEKIPGTSKKNLKQIRSELCTELAEFIARETNNIITSWPKTSISSSLLIPQLPFLKPQFATLTSRRYNNTSSLARQHYTLPM
ncbi:hypothetical protein PtB15_4B109 [Puccinia triticina]|nr:hypothetical protein PtB15_4B109 [Puccinia triticina]